MAKNDTKLPSDSPEYGTGGNEPAASESEKEVQSTANSPSTAGKTGDTPVGISARHGAGGQYVALGGGRVIPASEV